MKPQSILIFDLFGHLLHICKHVNLSLVAHLLQTSNHGLHYILDCRLLFSHYLSLFLSLLVVICDDSLQLGVEDLPARKTAMVAAGGHLQSTVRQDDMKSNFPCNILK